MSDPVPADQASRGHFDIAVDSSAADVFVRRINALYPLNAHETSAISELVHGGASIPSHHEILQEGKASKEAVILLSGLACHHKVLGSGRRQITGFVVAGDFCDFGFLSSSPIRQSVMSLGPAVIGKIDLGQLSSVADKLPNIVVAAMRAASIDQAIARELVISLGARDALQRLAHFLCEMHSRLSIVGLAKGGQFELLLTQAELGEALGLSTVHVNRMIQQLRKQKLIAMSQGRVSILDLPELAAIASFDGRYLQV